MTFRSLTFPQHLQDRFKRCSFTPHFNRDILIVMVVGRFLKQDGLFLTPVNHGNGEHQEFWDFAGDQVI